MCWHLNAHHFGVLAGFPFGAQNWVGHVPSTWAQQISGQGYDLPDHPLTRDELIDLCQPNNERTNQEVFLAVMSWGGMQRNHGRAAWNSANIWLPIVQNLRAGELDSIKAYQQFLDANIPGLAPAYFTKLIFFCSPNHDGYIMDQWTGKSINLLFQNPNGAHPIHIQSSWVTRRNTSETYACFCQLIDELAQHMNCTPAQAEMKLFSNGANRGQQRGPWRQYVIDNYHHL
jgi:hypothetical protein